MHRNYLSLFATALVFLISCSPSIKTQSSDFDYMYITKQGVIQKPLITDLEVGKQRVSMSRTYRNITIANAKENILGEFIQQNSCDVVLQPFFTSSSENSATKTTVNVTLNAYPASYKNIRPYEPRDTAYLLPTGYFLTPSTTPLPTNTQSTVPAKKQNVGGKLLLGALLAGGIAYGALMAQ